MIEKEQREVERRPITKITHKGEIEIESDAPMKEQEAAMEIQVNDDNRGSMLYSARNTKIQERFICPFLIEGNMFLLNHFLLLILTVISN